MHRPTEAFPWVCNAPPLLVLVVVGVVVVVVVVVVVSTRARPLSLISRYTFSCTFVILMVVKMIIFSSGG
jgi:hypothetical protein